MGEFLSNAQRHRLIGENLSMIGRGLKFAKECLLDIFTWPYHISGIFDSDFNLAVWQFFLNRQPKITANTIFKRTL